MVSQCEKLAVVAMVCFMGNGWLRVVRDVAGGWFASELAGGFAAMRGLAGHTVGW